MSDDTKKNESLLTVSEHPDYKIISEEYLRTLKYKSYNYENNKAYKYFEKSLQFYQSVKERQVSSLTDKQKNWLWEISCTIHDRIGSGQLAPPNEEALVAANFLTGLMNTDKTPSVKPETFIQKLIRILCFWKK